jgi:hypothetical protein
MENDIELGGATPSPSSETQMKVKTMFSVVALCAVTATTAEAQQTLTFEGFLSGAVLTTQYAGINFQGATILTSGISLNPTFPPRSGLNVVYNPVGAMELLFSSDLDFFEGYFTYNSGLRVDGYSASNALLTSSFGSTTVNSVGNGTPNELVRIDAAGIRRVVITGGTGNNFTLDDARFTGSRTQEVPEPASLVLIATGASMLAVARRRRRNA